MDLAAAVRPGTLVGPAQVMARVIEMGVGRFHHPIWTKLTSTTMVAVGLALLWSGLPVTAVALVCYGAGIGLESIARGTVPWLSSVRRGIRHLWAGSPARACSHKRSLNRRGDHRKACFDGGLVSLTATVVVNLALSFMLYLYLFLGQRTADD